MAEIMRRCKRNWARWNDERFENVVRQFRIVEPDN